MRPAGKCTTVTSRKVGSRVMKYTPEISVARLTMIQAPTLWQCLVAVTNRVMKYTPEILSLAQLDSALGYELRGWGFEFLRTGQLALIV